MKKEAIKDLKDIPEPDAPKNKTPSLPAMTGPGVETQIVPVLDKAIRKYEKAKDVRCLASPDEVAAKKELQFALHQSAASLPTNSDGFKFYRSDEFEKDFILEEKMKMRKFGAEDEDDE